MSTSATITADDSVPIIFVRGVNKTYAGGFQALKNINLDIKRGEIFALLGPNGAGKTTLISIICGIVNATSGTIIADGHDTVRDYRAARATIGLVPQELHTEKEYRKRNGSGAVYDDPRVAVGAGRFDEVGARAEA